MRTALELQGGYIAEVRQYQEATFGAIHQRDMKVGKKALSRIEDTFLDGGGFRICVGRRKLRATEPEVGIRETRDQTSSR